MEISLSQYAVKRGVSQRRAEQLAASGAIMARKVGRIWLVDDRELLRRQRRSRPLSKRVAHALIAELSGREPLPLSPKEQSRQRERLAALHGSEDPSALLSTWLHARHKRVVRLAANPSDLGDIAADPRAVVSGVSDSRAHLSSKRELEVYVAERDLASFVRENLLVQSASPNVQIHVVDEPIPRPAPLGLVLADLADWNSPREDGRVIELLKDSVWNR